MLALRKNMIGFEGKRRLTGEEIIAMLELEQDT